MLQNIQQCFIRYARCMRFSSAILRKSLIQRTFHSSVRILIPSSNKDYPTPFQLAPLEKLYDKETDILLEELRKAKSIDRVLELTSMHLEVMNNSHLSTSFQTIHTMIRMNRLDPNEINLTDNEIFQNLCSRVMDRARYLASNEVIVIYKTLCKLNVPSSTYVMQALLKMLCSQINELNLSQLTFLNFLLAKQPRNALVNSLVMALPLVLQVQIDQQLDSDNLNEVVSTLKMACKARLKPAAIEKVVSIIQRKVPEFSAGHAVAVISALFYLETPVNGYMNLLSSTFQVLSEKLNDVSRDYLLLLLRLCVKRSLYHSAFFMQVSKLAVKDKWTLEETYELVHRLHKINFFSPELLDHLCDTVASNSDDISQNKRYDPLNLSEYLSFADYKPSKLYNALGVISSPSYKHNTLCQNVPYLYLKMVSCWTMLGWFPHEYLHNVLDEEYLFSAWSLSRKAGRSADFEKYACYLQWGLEIYDKTEEFEMPKDFMKQIYQSVQHSCKKSKEFPLEKFLESGLGGSQFVRNAVITQNGHVIDHVVALRSGNYPVSLNFDNSINSQLTNNLEQIIVPEDARIVAVIAADEDDYCTDPELMKGYMALKIKHLKKMSITPILINYNTWTEYPDREKIPFLMRELKQAIENEDVVKSDTCPSGNLF